MKTLNVKIPVKVAQRMDDKGELNSSWVAYFLIENMHKEINAEPVTGLTVIYSCKVDNLLHKEVKLKAIEHDLPMTEFVGRLLERYYR